MKFFFKNIFFNDIRPLAFILSIFISLIIYSNNQPVNIDGIVQYFPSALAFLKSGFHAAMQIHKWPLYSILIAIFSKGFHLSLLHAAFVLNTLLLATMIVAFITLVKELCDDSLILKVAAFIILTCHPLNTFRDQVVREFGFFAFLFIALVFFIRFSRTQKFIHALTYAVFMMIATLFRIEGAFLICFIPFALFLKNDLLLKQRIILIVKTHALNVIVLILILLWIFAFRKHQISQLGRFADFVDQFQHVYFLVFSNVTKKALALSAFYQLNEARFIISFGTFGYFIYSVISTFGLIYIILAIHGFFVAKMVNVFSRKILIFITFLTILPPLGYYFQGVDFSNRYVMPFCLLLSVWVPFSLVAIFNAWRQKQKTFIGKRWFFILVVLILIIYALSGIFRIFGPSKAYITEASQWVRTNIPNTEIIYTNCDSVIYYANLLPWGEVETDKDKAQKLENFKNNVAAYNYAVLRINKNQNVVEETLLIKNNLQPIKIFQNRRHDRVVIYKIRK